MITKRLIPLAALFCTLAIAAQPAFAGGEAGNGHRSVFAGGETGNGKTAATLTLPR